MGVAVQQDQHSALTASELTLFVHPGCAGKHGTPPIGGKNLATRAVCPRTWKCLARGVPYEMNLGCLEVKSLYTANMHHGKAQNIMIYNDIINP